MQTWKSWKSGFDAWEQSTATWLEQVMQSPMLLGPAGSVMSAAMRAKAEADKQAAAWWGQAGLAIKRDQERAMHGINQLGSKLLDVQEELASQRDLMAAQSEVLAAQSEVLTAQQVQMAGLREALAEGLAVAKAQHEELVALRKAATEPRARAPRRKKAPGA